MRRLGFILTLLSLPLAAQTPYGRLDFQLQTAQGQAVAGATVYVYAQSACGVAADLTTPATIYLTATGTVFPQPVITDGFGTAAAYAPRGCYTVVYYSSYTGTLTRPDTNATAASSSGNAAGTNAQVQYNNSGVFGGSQATLDAAGNLTTPASVVTPKLGAIWLVDGFAAGAWRGAWSAGSFAKCDAVSYSGSSYVAGIATSATPGSSNDWAIVNSTGASVVPTQIDCAVAAARSYGLANSQYVDLVLGSGNYNTCTGLMLADPIAVSRFNVNLIGSAIYSSTITQSCALPAFTNSSGSIPTATVWLPIKVGGNYDYRVALRNLYVDAAHNADYAVALEAGNVYSTIDNLTVRNGNVGNGIFGTDGTTDGWMFQALFNHISTSSQGTFGAGATVTVSLSGGVPALTVTAGGSAYVNPQLYLLGTQTSASDVPCTSMGTTALTVSGGVITGASTTATGCSGTVYGWVWDGPPIETGLDFAFVTDSTLNDIISAAGKTRGMYFRHGNNTITSAHPESWGVWGIQSDQGNRFIGTNCGEQLEGCFNLQAVPSTVVATRVYTSLGNPFYMLYHMSSITGFGTFFGSSCGNGMSLLEFQTISSPTMSVHGFGALPGNNTAIGLNYCGPTNLGAMINSFPATQTEMASLDIPLDSASPLLTIGTGTATPNAIQISNRSLFGYNSAGFGAAVVQGTSGHGIDFNVANSTFGSGTVGVFDANGNFGVGTDQGTATNDPFYVTTAGAVHGASFSGTITRSQVTNPAPLFLKFAANGTITSTGTVDPTPALTQAITVDSITAFVLQAPAGCSTYPVLVVRDTTSTTDIATFTLAAATVNYTPTVSVAAVPATHVLALRVNTAPVGCGTNATYVTVHVQYH